MGNGQFKDLYAEIDKGYLLHKQNQYKNYKEPAVYYSEELFWDKLVHLGWRKDYTTTECLVLVCPVCETSITKVILKHFNDIRGLLNVKDKIEHHTEHYCRAIGKAEQE